ncbi:hypothetical protein CSUB01_11576 [Colletotrichum sublineola]|uniref:Uncharacterized protein n=1 Tax=Colletotrichum sublineola TaxID=1173701 RepID=A0A066XII4_COLSU|nr:hypothetical protein CSUB01_11576 [Colletotrichum sublineola]
MAEKTAQQLVDDQIQKFQRLPSEEGISLFALSEGDFTGPLDSSIINRLFDLHMSGHENLVGVVVGEEAPEILALGGSGVLNSTSVAPLIEATPVGGAVVDLGPAENSKRSKRKKKSAEKLKAALEIWSDLYWKWRTLRPDEPVS